MPSRHDLAGEGERKKVTECIKNLQCPEHTGETPGGSHLKLNKTEIVTTY